VIRNTYKKLMVLLASAAVAFEISAPAQAAVDSATPAASAGCSGLGFGSVIVDRGDGYRAAVSTSGLLEFVAADQPNGFCFGGVANTDFIVLYPPGSTGCLAWSQSAKDVYLHSPALCGSNTNYLEWLEVQEGSDSNGTYFIFQNQYSGMCFYSYGGSSTPVYGACNAASRADEFYTKAAPA
jgi:hypothetical protein